MKRFAYTLLAVIFTLTACQKIETPATAEQNVVLSATIEHNLQTKTSIGNSNNVVWSSGDQIIAFMKSSAGNQLQVLPSFAGGSHAEFSTLSGDNPTVGSEWSHIVAYYPYSSSVKCTKSSNNYSLSVVIPSEQTYTSKSFGNNTFPMVAVSSSSKLAFKNVCGGIKFKFKGSAKVASVTIKGNNNEKLSGAATVTAKSDGSAPSISMSSSASKEVTLKCTSSVQLSQSSATEFILTLPPVTFSKGFTVTVTDTDKRTYTVTTSKSNSVTRSNLLVMPEVTLVRDAIIEDNLSGWTNVTSSYGSLPEYIKIFKSPSTLQGKSAVAYIAVADLKLGARWDVWSVMIDKSGWLGTYTPDSFLTPSVIYSVQKCPVIINGGYFYTSGSDNHTASLATRNSLAPLSYNINYAYDASNTTCYPTRGAFLEYENGTIDACWTYALWNWEHYMYPAPAPANNTTQPSASYPSGGKAFAAKTGIGGGPVLINNGTIVNTYSEEMLSGTNGINPTSTEPRTAIGVTANKEVVFFVCEGRGMTSGVYGFSTYEVAKILSNIGCVEAINLDGGGSSCMLVNGKSTIKVSDGSQRAVANAVMLF